MYWIRMTGDYMGSFTSFRIDRARYTGRVFSRFRVEKIPRHVYRDTMLLSQTRSMPALARLTRLLACCIVLTITGLRA